METNIKDLVKDKKVKFLYYRSKELWYEVDGTGFRFPVPVDDTGEAAFYPRIRQSFLCDIFGNN